MVHDLDETIRKLLKTAAPSGSLLADKNTVVSFDLPDAAWRSGHSALTVNCYLYDIRENVEMRTTEPLRVSSANGMRAGRVAPPVRIDCAYCITCWSSADREPVIEEHRLLSEVLLVLLKNPTIPRSVLQGALSGQIPPYPTVVAAPDGVKNLPDFWSALDQRLKPSLNYVVTLAVMLDDLEESLGTAVRELEVGADQP